MSQVLSEIPSNGRCVEAAAFSLSARSRLCNRVHCHMNPLRSALGVLKKP
jgi:hypothetical protein